MDVRGEGVESAVEAVMSVDEGGVVGLAGSVDVKNLPSRKRHDLTSPPTTPAMFGKSVTHFVKVFSALP